MEGGILMVWLRNCESKVQSTWDCHVSD